MLGEKISGEEMRETLEITIGLIEVGGGIE